MLDHLGKDGDLGVVELFARSAGLDFGDQDLGAVMLDEGLVDHLLVFDRFLAGRIEDLFLDRGMHRQLGADLFRELRLLVGAVGVFELGEQAFDLAMVGFQQGNGIGLGSFGHGVRAPFKWGSGPDRIEASLAECSRTQSVPPTRRRRQLRPPAEEHPAWEASSDERGSGTANGIKKERRSGEVELKVATKAPPARGHLGARPSSMRREATIRPNPASSIFGDSRRLYHEILIHLAHGKKAVLTRRRYWKLSADSDFLRAYQRPIVRALALSSVCLKFMNDFLVQFCAGENHQKTDPQPHHEADSAA
jgi:hypothetical protein